MQRPQYWEDDEVWEVYNTWLAKQPAPAPKTQIQLAIERVSQVDVVEGIRLCNALWGILRNKNK